MRKSIFARTAAVLMCAAAALSAVGCGASAAADAASESGSKLKIVCTGFSEYDWTKNLLGSHADEAELTYLLDNGVDMHSYQPTAADMAKIAESDIFIYIGGESQEWADDAVKESVNEKKQSIKLLDVLAENGAAKEEELKEGMQSDEEEDEGGEEEGAPEYDEHIWLTPGNAVIFSETICDALKTADPDHAADYSANLDSYKAELEALSKEFSEGLGACEKKTMIIADRFPFRYLADEYGLEYYAAFSGCSAETEASFETVTFLAGKADEVGASTIFTLESSDGKLAQAVIDSTKGKSAKTVQLNSLQSVTEEQIKDGATYTGIMREDLKALIDGLS